MIVTLELKDFRGKTDSYHFGRLNRLLGTNEAGKSTIGEALAFAFAGTDSIGGKAPVHLISWGSDSCSVKVQTGKAIIQRTLTKKKNGTLKLIRDGVPQTLTQTQLEGLLGASADLFLSVMFPGYFWGCSGPRQQAVLTEVLPAFDVGAFLEECLQDKLTTDEWNRFSFNEKRPDLVASSIAAARLDLQRILNVNAGRLAALQTSVVEDMPQNPIEPPEVAMLNEMRKAKEEFSSYQNKLTMYRKVCENLNAVEAKNLERRARRKEIEERLATVGESQPLPVFPDSSKQEIVDLRAKILPKPQSPQLVNVVDADTCSTCGQVVGAKHKEKIRAENNKRLAEFEEQVKQVEAFNEEISNRIRSLLQEESVWRDRFNQVQAYNNSLRHTKASLEGELAGLEDLPLPSVPSVPQEPASAYNESEELRLRSIVEHYERQCTEYVYAREQMVRKSMEISRINNESEPLRYAVDRLQKLEEAVKKIPDARLMKQAEQLFMDGYELVIDDTSLSTSVYLRRKSDGCPLELLSTGARMTAQNNFSLKLNSLMKRPVGVMFVDNADLIASPINLPVQLFCAEVTPGETALRVVVD